MLGQGREKETKTEKVKETVTGFLEEIQPSAAIWDESVDIGDGSDAWKLWNEVDDLAGMGTTKTSKLLAAKRPNLVPILDDVVRLALFNGSRREVDREYWNLWREELTGSSGEKLRGAVDLVRGRGQGLRTSLVAAGH